MIDDELAGRILAATARLEAGVRELRDDVARIDLAVRDLARRSATTEVDQDMLEARVAELVARVTSSAAASVPPRASAWGAGLGAVVAGVITALAELIRTK